VRRIQEKKPVEKTIWEPVSVPMARFIAFEQMARGFSAGVASGPISPEGFFASRVSPRIKHPEQG
jgi:hypothetical protein